MSFLDRPVFTSPNWKLGVFWSGNTKAAIASLRRTKWRSFFTMMGVIIGISSVVTVVSLGEGLKQQVTGQIQQLGSDVVTVRPGKLVNRNDRGGISGVNLLAFLGASTLTDKDVKSLSAMNTTQTVAPFDFVTSSASGDSGSSDNLAVIGTSSSLGSMLNLKLGFGAFFGDSESGGFSAVIGNSAALKLFDMASPFGHTLSTAGGEFIIRGSLKPSAGGLLNLGQTDFNSTIFIPYGAAKKLTNNNVNLTQILVKLKPGTNIDQGVLAIRQTLRENHNNFEDFTVLKQNELLDVSDRVVNSLTGFISSIAAISLLVGGIGIMDIMLVAVSERTREIGIRKAIGATNRQILNQFLTEGLVLSVGGGIIGLIVSLIADLIMRLYTGLHPVLSISTILMAMGVSILVGVVFSGAPALKAARKLPIEALRGE